MRLKDLLIDIDYLVVNGSDEISVDAVCWDSRRVAANSLFICTKNKNINRHQYAVEAISKGASALLIQEEIENIPPDITVLMTCDTRYAMACAASRFFDEPSKKFNLIGVTGTNGKTSVTFFIEKILRELGRNTGLIGTIKNTINGIPLNTPKLNPTTPDSIELQQCFCEMVKNGAQDVVMEVTSSALSQHRVDCCDFHIGIFTNFSQDHLEEHGTMENYKQSKLKLFKMCRLGIINVDDPVSQEIISSSTSDLITYGINKEADFRAKEIIYDSDSTKFLLDFHGSEKSVNISLPGIFNVYNALCAISTCYFLGFPLESIISALSCLEGIPGRFEYVKNPKHIHVIVDYAHTPAALENVLVSLRKLRSNKIITVFGCGGDRDKTKRALMGEIAGKLSDFCIITSDNPRTESPADIIKHIEAGIKNTSCPYKKLENRTEAIICALSMAEKDDTILIAGKGHEEYQIIGKDILPFSDINTVDNFFKPNKQL